MTCGAREADGGNVAALPVALELLPPPLIDAAATLYRALGLLNDEDRRLEGTWRPRADCLVSMDA